MRLLRPSVERVTNGGHGPKMCRGALIYPMMLTLKDIDEHSTCLHGTSSNKETLPSCCSGGHKLFLNVYGIPLLVILYEQRLS